MARRSEGAGRSKWPTGALGPARAPRHLPALGSRLPALPVVPVVLFRSPRTSIPGIGLLCDNRSTCSNALWRWLVAEGVVGGPPKIPAAARANAAQQRVSDRGVPFATGHLARVRALPEAINTISVFNRTRANPPQHGAHALSPGT